MDREIRKQMESTVKQSMYDGADLALSAIIKNTEQAIGIVGGDRKITMDEMLEMAQMFKHSYLSVVDPEKLSEVRG